MNKIGLIGAGFIGKALIKKFSENLKYEISVFDRNECPLNLRGTIKWTRGDFKDELEVSKFINGLDCVYNFIPEDQSANFIHSPNLFNNIGNQINFLKNCNANGVQKVIFASSAAVYGIQDQFPITELAQTNPISQYGINKLMIEKYYLMAAREFDLEVCVARIANPFGAGQFKSNFIQSAINAIKDGTVLTIVEDGAYIRDFIYIEDISNMLVEILECKNLPLIVNLSSGSGYSLKYVVDTIRKITNKNFSIKSIHSRKNDIPISVLSNEKYKKYVNPKFKANFEDNLKKYLEKEINW